MRVVINGRFLTQPLTGVQRYAREVVKELDLLIPEYPGVHIEILTPELRRDPPKYQNINVRAVGRLQGHAWEQIDLPRWVAKNDILFCPANTAPAALLVRRHKVVVTVHDLSYRYFPEAYSFSFKLLYNLLMPLIMRRARRVITVSESEREEILRLYPSIKSRLSVVANGGSPANETRASDRLAELKPYVLYVGSFTKRKNFPTLVTAAIRLLRERKNLRFLFVGGSPSIFAATDVEQSLVHERLLFEGQVEDTSTLDAYYASAEVFVFPSLYESSGLPPTEAMACGCPVVISRIPALQERCGEAAVYCDPRDPDSILEAVCSVLDDHDLRKFLVAQGLMQSRMYTWAICAKQTLGVMLTANY